MSQELTRNNVRELSPNEAKGELQKALKLIRNNTIQPPNYRHRFFSSTVENAIITSGCLVAVLSLVSAISFTFPSLLIGLAVNMISLAINLILLDWNGNPKNRLASFLVNTFGTKKKKIEAKALQEEYLKYSQSMELFKLYVADIKMSLDERGILDTINQNDKYNHHSIDEDGTYHISKVEPEKTHTMALNDARVDEMIKSLAKSPRMKEQLQIGLSK